MSGPFGSTAWMANPASGFYDFPISNSLRFNSDTDTSYLSFTPSSAGNLNTWSWSAWVKKSLNDNDQCVFSCATAVSALYIDNDESFVGFDGTYGGTRTLRYSTNKTRDVSAWYHVLFVLDTTQGTAANRLRVYVNGVEDALATAQVNTYPAQDSDGGINTAVQHAIGRRDSTTDLYFGGYLAEINFIDGTALTPSSFGETKNDIWIPKDTAGLTFGNQGFRLQFKQSGTSQNSSGIGADTSGNDNHWAVNNLVASDVMPDSPTNNFATYNSIAPDTTGATNHSFSEGNLKVTQNASSGSRWWNCFGTIGMSSGKYYWEHYALGSGTVDLNIGVCTLDWYRGSNGGADTADAYTLYANSGGKGYLYTDGATPPVDKGSSHFWTWGDVMGVAFDADTGKIWYAKNGTFLGSGDPAAGSNEMHTVTSEDLAKGMLPVFSGESASGTPMVNFGQDSSFAGNETAQGNADGNGIGDFYYAPPSGFLALCTANLPDPVATIDPNKGGSPQDYFNTVLYTGNGSDNRSITGAGFDPDWVWIKTRNEGYSHVLGDSVRGNNKFLHSNTTATEDTNTGAIQDFITDGFQVGTYGGVNQNTKTYVAWNWKAGTAFSNDASATSVGSIDSAGSVNSDLGFSIINFTGTGSALTVAHGLSQAPELIIEKSRDKNDYWLVYAAYLGNTKGLILGNTDSVYTSTTFWNDTSPTSSVWTMGDQNAVNNSGEETIAYCFHSVENYSKIGSYTGNSDADGTFVYTGFRPAFVLIKNTGATESWNIFDTARDPSNLTTQNLNPNSANAESDASSGNRAIDILSNGFKLRGNNSAVNDGTFLYLTFSEQPFKYANAR